MLVDDIMTRGVVTATKSQPLTQIAAVMSERKLGLVVVVDDETGRTVIGVLSDSDIIRKAVAAGRSPSQILVQDIMTPNVITIKKDSTVSDAAGIMRTYSLKRLPVTENGQLIGIISSTDIIRSLIDVKKALLDLALKF